MNSVCHKENGQGQNQRMVEKGKKKEKEGSPFKVLYTAESTFLSTVEKSIGCLMTLMEHGLVSFLANPCERKRRKNAPTQSSWEYPSPQGRQEC